MAKKPSDPAIALPHPLTEAIKSKRAIVFLGAGASKEARNARAKSPPDADQLRDILAQKFFGRAIPNRDVMAVAEMAISASGGSSLVYEAVRVAFDGFQPSKAHLLLAEFNWRLIATTNYDCLVEKAYSESTKRAQTLIRFVKDDEPVEDRLQSAINPVQYLKLHGCLDHIFDNDIPLILSREQYAAYSTHRTRLFGRLSDLARESTIIFIGYRLDDPHIRELIYKLDSQKRPRWYIVTPDAEDYDVTFWASKNIEVIKCRFGEFMAAAANVIPPLWRSLPVTDAVTEFPIRKFYVVRTEESLTLKASLHADLTFVHTGMPSAAQTPKRFYEGYDTGWGGIILRFDARRKIEDELLYVVLLENENPTSPIFFMIKGPAGCGKTIALKRTAFEAATASNALVLWLEEAGALNPESFIELHELTKRPIYLFVDHIALHVEKVHALLKVAQARSLPLVVVGAERDADWNTFCGPLESAFDPHDSRVGNLSRGEVETLIALLERHDCLGLLKEKTHDERIDAFMGKADRQLLVALHELTQGKPFEEIVFYEHQSVHPEQARQLYLDIASMHQFGVKARAGTISRISGIYFDDYKENFFDPLENIVRVDIDPYTGDYCYLTRHAHVATLVFRQVCSDDDAKAKQFKRLINGLDIGYSSDRRALEEMTRGRVLAENFADEESVRCVYETATKVAPKQAFLWQQWAIFESNHSHGSIIAAEAHAAHAHELEPRNKTIIHTQAEIDRKRAVEEKSPILKESLRRRARARLSEMPAHDRFAISSRCKLLVDEVSDLSRNLADDAKTHDALFFADKVKDAEGALFRAQQEFPDDADIIQIEARLRQELDQEDRALRAMERAWSAGPRGSGIAIRLARIYDARSRHSDAHKILNEALARDSEDKAAHQALALHMLRQNNCDYDVVEQHLRSSFAIGDNNFDARYVLAEFLFFRGKVGEAAELFAIIDDQAPQEFRRLAPRKDSIISAQLPRFSGMVDSMKARFLFIRSSSYPRSIFSHHSNIDPDILSEISVGQDLNFRLRFNRAGPTAVDLRLGRADGR
jgi:SIR2-like domain/Tetratricopeptide repeat/'Cold-shock' DNA-binding domain